jgi:hypothetical protein
MLVENADFGGTSNYSLQIHRLEMLTVNFTPAKLQLPTGKPFPLRTLYKSFQCNSNGKNHFSTTAQRRVVRFPRDQRQSMPVSNGHHHKPQPDTAKSYPPLHWKHMEIHT